MVGEFVTIHVEMVGEKNHLLPYVSVFDEFVNICCKCNKCCSFCCFPFETSYTQNTGIQVKTRQI